MMNSSESDDSEKILTAKNRPKLVNKKADREDQMELSEASTSHFETPKRTSKLSSILKPNPPINTSNHYNPLNDVQEREPIYTNIQITKPKTPPPIVLSGRPNNHNEFISEIKSNIKKGFSIKYAPRSVLLYIHDLDEYKKYKTKLSNTDNLQFLTYTTKDEKTHTFVLRGLDSNVQTDEIKDELENYGLYVKDIYKMKTKSNNLYLVITDTTITVTKLNTEIRHINYTKVTWERRYNERQITQCRRRREEKPKTDKPKCANCGDDHTAASVECPVYKAKVAKLEKTTSHPQEHRRYVPAPQPSTNPWTRRDTTETAPTLNSTHTTRNTIITQAHTIQAGGTEPPISDFETLMDELDKLNKKVNLREAIKAIARLNQMLESAKNAMETIMILQDFSKSELTKFQILGNQNSI